MDFKYEISLESRMDVLGYLLERVLWCTVDRRHRGLRGDQTLAQSLKRGKTTGVVNIRCVGRLRMRQPYIDYEGNNVTPKLTPF